MNTELEEIIESELKLEQDQGYYIHKVVDDNDKLISCHTHGLLKNFGHIDLEVTLNIMPIDIAEKILNHICREYIIPGKIRFINNKSFMLTSLSFGNFRRFTVKLTKDEFGCYVYKLIFYNNDKNNHWGNDIDPIYKGQWTEEDEYINDKILNKYYCLESL